MYDFYCCSKIVDNLHPLMALHALTITVQVCAINEFSSVLPCLYDFFRPVSSLAVLLICLLSHFVD